MFIDTHAHISCKDLGTDTENILKRAIEAKLSCIINVSCSTEHMREELEWIKVHSEDSLPLYSSIGIHPDRFSDPNEEDTLASITSEINVLEEIYSTYASQIVAIGECGLDYYRTFHKEAQKALFRRQILLAEHLGLPLVIHLRGEVWEDFFQIIQDTPHIKAVIHCFGGDVDITKKLLVFPNIMLSFTGIITFKNALETYKNILEILPLSRVMIETDCPYLAPTPYRGTENEPAYVVEVARRIAEIKGISLEETGEITSMNAKKFFGI